MSVKPILFSSLFILSAAVHADFNWQVDANYMSTENDYDINIANIDEEADGYGVQGKYYLSSVVVDQLPIREAAFLGKQSNVGIQYITAEQSKPKNVKDDRASIMLDADIRIGESAFRAGGFIGDIDEKFTGYDYSAIKLGGMFGWHIQDNSLLTFKLYTEIGDNDYSGSTTLDTVTSGFGVDYRQVLVIGSGHIAFGGGIEMETIVEERIIGDDFTDASVGINAFVTWYMTQKLGLGVKIDSYGYAYDDDRPIVGGDAKGYEVLELAASYDFNEVVGFNKYLPESLTSVRP